MPQRIKRIGYLALSVSLTALCALAACASVPPNYSETTAPALTWIVRDASGVSQTFTASGSVIHTTIGTTYTVALRADDSGGLKEITLDENSAWACGSGDTLTQHGPSLGVSHQQGLPLDANGNAETSFTWFANETVGNAAPGDFTCQSGSLQDAADTYLGTSTNYSSKKATSVLTFTTP